MEMEMVTKRVKVVEGDGLKMGGFLGGRRLSSIIWGRGKIVQIVQRERERERRNMYGLLSSCGQKEYVWIPFIMWALPHRSQQSLC